MIPLSIDDPPIDAPEGCHAALEKQVHVGVGGFFSTPNMSWSHKLTEDWTAIYLMAFGEEDHIKMVAHLQSRDGKIYLERWNAPRVSPAVGGRRIIAISGGPKLELGSWMEQRGWIYAFQPGQEPIDTDADPVELVVDGWENQLATIMLKRSDVVLLRFLVSRSNLAQRPALVYAAMLPTAQTEPGQKG